MAGTGQEFKDRVPIDEETGALNVNIVGGTIDIGDITISGINIGDGDDVAEGTTTDPAYAGSGDSTVISALKGIYNAVISGGGGGGSQAVTIADGDDAAEGTTTDNMVAAGATGTVSGKLRRVTQGLEDLKTLIVLGASNNRIGKVTVRNAANSSDIDPLADSTFTGRVGEVQDTPTSFTLLDRLKTIGTGTTGTLTSIGEVQASPTTNTVLDRLKTLKASVDGLLTGIVLAAGSARIGKVTVRNAADNADIDPLVDSTFTGRVGAIGDTAYAGSGDATVIAALKGIYDNNTTSTVADGDDVTQGAIADAAVAAGAAGTISAKLRRLTQGIEDLKTLIVLGAGSARIGKVTVRNAADSADIDPLADSTFTGRVGEVQASPTANTLLDRLKTIGTNTASTVTAIGEVQASPTANTVLDRLKALKTSVDGLLTGIVLAAGSARIGKVTVRNSADNADIDPVSDSTFTGRIGEVQASPTSNTVLDRLKTVGTNTGTTASNTTDISDATGTPSDSAYAGSGDTTVIAALKGIYATGGGGGGAVTIADGADVAQGDTSDAAYAGSGDATIISILKGIYASGGGAATIADGDDVTEGAIADAAVAAGAAGTISAKLRRLTQGVEDLKTLIVLGASSARIGKITVRNAADSADIDPLADATFTATVGAVTASPTANTLLDRLKAIKTSVDSLLTGVVLATGSNVIGNVGIADGSSVTEGAIADAVVAAGAAGTISAKLRRLTQGVEDLKTLIVLGAGSARIGKVTIRNAADAADIDPLADSTFTTTVGAVTASPTANTVQDRLKTIGTNTLQYGSAANPAAVSVTSTATSIIAANAARISCLIFNNGAVTVYLGGSGVTTSTGIPLPAGCGFSSEHSRNAWYGIVATGTADVRYTEIS